ncbi:MAG: thiolase family protein [Hyphomonas sp.]
MSDLYIIGSYSSVFGKQADRSYKDITREVYLGALSDAGMSDGVDIGSCWFSNFGMHAIGQGGIRGQVCLDPLIKESLFPTFAPIWNVENGCASGAYAFNGALKDLRAGDAQLSVAIGVEKLTAAPGADWDPFKVLAHGIDQLDPNVWEEYYLRAAKRAGKDLKFGGAGKSMFMDTYSTQAAYHMKKYGTTQRQFAIAAAKTHTFGADNPRAQYRFAMTPDEVLDDRLVSFPLTRSMCSPIGDGGAAILVCSEDYLRNAPPSVRERAIKVRASAASSGRYRDLDEPSMTSIAAQRAYEQAGVQPSDIDLAEVHDASTFSEIYQAEMMGFCAEGKGGALHESGETGLGGRIPMNTSGGLVSKGHPIGATGISMLTELVEQLRGEAGVRQVKGARLALAENGGGIVGLDEAACIVTILEHT